MTYQVGKLPYAVLIDAGGTLRARGLVNTREHLESLFEAKERGVASVQEYVQRERAQREVARRSSRRGSLAQLAAVLVGGAAVPLLSVARGQSVGRAPDRAPADPSTDYILYCRGCHGPDGSGAPGAVPSFAGHLAKFLYVPGGREFLVRVPGVSQSELDDAGLAALLNWALQAFSPAELPLTFVPYSAAEVAAMRRPPLTDVSGSRRRLLEQIDAIDRSRAGPRTSP